MEKLIIFDTTLRDGEQSPGATMTAAEKMEVARALDAMGVDIIEAGFPMSSKEDFESVQAISKQLKHAKTCALARSMDKDIEVAAESLKLTNNKRIHLFISTSDIHIKHKLRSTREEVLGIVKQSVLMARKFTDDVEWSAEDSTRSDYDYLTKCVEAAILAGATTINLPDTLGYQLPDEHFSHIHNMMARVKNLKGAEKVIFSVHCHNDLGMATANTLAGIRGGARQAEVTMIGLGERAGSAALEEVVMGLNVRKDVFNLKTNIDSAKLLQTAKLVSRASGFAIPRNKAIVGGNAFAHESGIHQDGMLKCAQTYEIMTPQSVGVEHMDIVIGKHSGRTAFKKKLSDLKISADEKQLEIYFCAMKDLACKKKNITDEDIKNLCR